LIPEHLAIMATIFEASGRAQLRKRIESSSWEMITKYKQRRKELYVWEEWILRRSSFRNSEYLSCLLDNSTHTDRQQHSDQRYARLPMQKDKRFSAPILKTVYTYYQWMDRHIFPKSGCCEQLHIHTRSTCGIGVLHTLIIKILRRLLESSGECLPMDVEPVTDPTPVERITDSMDGGGAGSDRKVAEPVEDP